MSTLVAQTISNGSVSTSSANVIQGSAKAWVNYNGATQAIRGSYNVSSVTYTSAGVYTINFTNALANANYAVAGMTGFSQGTPNNATSGAVFIAEGYPVTTTSFRVRVMTAFATLTDNGTTTLMAVGG